MKETLIFASNNQKKVDEIRAVPGTDFNIITMIESGIHIEIPEPHNSLEENAGEKSRTIYHMTQHDCFSEDTGLEVEALHGEPGVKSARYAGENRSDDDNINKLLNGLSHAENRNARFRTVISLIRNGKESLFEGICKGTINTEKRGLNGFGYDPVFIPEGSTKTFAEMDMTEKNLFSHRKKAVLKLVDFLNNI